MSSFHDLTASAVSLAADAYAAPHSVNCTVACAVIVLLSIVQYRRALKRDISVPAVGPSGRLTSYYGAFKFLVNARGMLEEGYAKYKSRTFKVPELGRWKVIISDPELIEQVRREPEETLSFVESVKEDIAAQYTLGHFVAKNPYHTGVIRTQLTRNLDVFFDDIMDEITCAFEENIGASENGWVSRPALDTVMQVVCRASNRVFIGLPLCRDKDYVELNIRFTIDVMLGAYTIAAFPDFMKNIVGELLTSVPKSTRRGIRHLGPIIEYRLQQYKEHGKDWPNKPNDMLSWLMDEADGEQQTVKALTQRLLTVNFSAVHTSSTSFTHALYHLATFPQYIAPIREEVEHVFKAEGWSKVSLARMRKLDSFMKEIHRYYGITMLSIHRKVLVDYTLADGTFLPAGSFLACNALSAHNEDANYDNAREFDGFRFLDTEKECAEEGARNQMVATGVSYLPWGYGRHSCPGRFFAANELKAMMAYLVLNYDFKMENEGVYPKNLEFGVAMSANAKAKVLFRKRRI